MRRLRLPGLLLLTPLLTVTAAAQEKPVTTPYYPLKVGNQWTYRTGKETVVIRVDKETPLEVGPGKDGGKSGKSTGFVLSVTSGAREREVTERVAVLADGVYRFSAAGKAVKPPLRFLKLPTKTGESWPIESTTADGKAIRGQFVAGSETIQLELQGRMFELPTVTVSSKDFRIGDDRITIKYWFAKDIGMVKQHVQIGKDEPVMLELRAFKAAP